MSKINHATYGCNFAPPSACRLVGKISRGSPPFDLGAIPHARIRALLLALLALVTFVGTQH